MAGTTKDMSLIKQVLLLKQQGMSNRGISRELKRINKETVNTYVRLVETNGWQIDDLLEIEDPVLDRMFHAGSPAYTDPRMKDFLEELPEYRDLLLDPNNHVTRKTVYMMYRKRHPDGYGQSQFYYHLKQNLVAQKDMVAVMAATYVPGQKLMVDFAGDRLSYVDQDTGETVKAEVFVACMPYSGYTFIMCVPSQKIEDFLYAIRMCLEHLGGVPPILCTDNLKAAVTKADRHEPEINKALEDMGDHYRFVAVPCDPASPTQKALVENAVRNAYNNIYPRVCGHTCNSLIELNQLLWGLMDNYNQTRMQKRPYTREERFHAMEKGCLKPLPETPYEMRYYADLQVQQNCHVELRHDKVTHFYSVPYTYVGRQAHVVFTRSWVRIYVGGQPVASHLRSHEYGYTTVGAHMASNNRVVMERSAAYYCAWARGVSDDCLDYIREVFNPQRTSQPEEVYYRLCGAVMGKSKNRDERDVFNLTCRDCLENHIFSYKRFEAVYKRNLKRVETDERVILSAPVPTDHANMRGAMYFAQSS